MHLLFWVYYIVFKIMKHVWNCVDEHASGSADIAKDFSFFGLSMNLKSKALLPIFKQFNELLFLFVVVNIANLFKDISLVFGIGSSRETTTPAHSLTLNVHKTALNDDVWP